MSQTTKRALAASLKKMLSQKTLDKITITDITQDCEVNRQTFYYHFHGIYDLLEWALLDEATKALEGKKTYATWQQGFLQIFEYVLENKPLFLNAYRSISREQVERYLHEVTYNLLIHVIEEKATGMNVKDRDKNFIADFYKFAFVGLMLEWISHEMNENPKDIIKRLSLLLQDDITEALERYAVSSCF